MKSLKFTLCAILSFSTLLFASSLSFAAEVVGCSMKQADFAYALDPRTYLMEYRFVPGEAGRNDFTLSSSACSMASAAKETISILNVTVGVIGLACSLAPEPVLTKSASAILVIGGIGLKYVEYTVQQVIDQCSDADRETKTKAQVEDAIKGYMQTQGYRVQ